MNNLNIHLNILLLAFLVIGCQPDHRNAHQTDPIYQFLEGEVAKVAKSISEVDKELTELDTPSADDEASLLTMKVAAHRKTVSLLRKERAALQQEHVYLQMKLQSRAHDVIFRSMSGEKIDGELELAVFKSRYRPRNIASE